jgi:RHS repeat-associated protein
MGFNGQERDTELGESVYTAEFWQYSANLGRRWNVDPKPRVSVSTYACLGNNPICFIDIKGDQWEDPKEGKKLEKNTDKKIEEKTSLIGNLNREIEKLEGEIQKLYDKEDGTNDENDKTKITKRIEEKQTELRGYQKQRDAAQLERMILRTFKDMLIEMGESKNVLFSFNEFNNKDGISFSERLPDKTIDGTTMQHIRMNFPLFHTNMQAHECVHGYQVLKGQLGATIGNPDRHINYDIYDEVAAYNIQYIFDPKSIHGSPKSIYDITPEFIYNINEEGDFIYKRLPNRRLPTE